VQLVTSVDSLRAHNAEVAIVLFAYGGLPAGLETSLEPYGVQIWQMGGYAERLASLSPLGWPALSRYPLLHKCLNFAEISALQPDQVLMLDCDTLFQGDVGALFDRYAEFDLVAREEVGSRRNHHPYDPQMADEDALGELGATLGITPAAPFNLGVMLLNHGMWSRLAGLAPLYVGYAWRFAVWMAMHQGEAEETFGEGLGIDVLRRQLASLPPAERHLALRYPSANRWILDEMALWMTLGHLPNTRQGDFARADAIQNGEFDATEQADGWTVCHYFSQNMETIAGWLRQRVMA
jgi:hypothetical protein